jgi:membrane fusion protein (multidrug efflux system)
VTVATAAYPKKSFSGTVAFISPTINSGNRSVSLYARVPNENNALAAGMFVNITHSLGKEEQVLMIPARSLVPALEGEQVYKIIEGKAYAVKVLIGRRTSTDVQILNGIAPNDTVITDGQLKVKNGVEVKIET